VEIAPDLVVVADRGGRVQAESRLSSADRVADAVVARVGAGGTVHIDAPMGVPGAVELGSLVADRLRAAGATVRHLDDRRLYAAASRRAPPGPRAAPDVPPRGRGARAGVRAPAAVAALLVVAVAAGISVRAASAPRPAATGEAILVEGRVAVRIPADWRVQRVTTGPGSARVQVVSPDDPEAVLHITESAVPTQDLAATAAELRIAAEAQPPGVIADFKPDDRRAGRPTVTYREVRPGHDIRWNVVVAGGVRIAIGCQNAPGRDRPVADACARAVESAHEIR
jgi:type VII secretion-associated protein (TIGR03931 family)